MAIKKTLAKLLARLWLSLAAVIILLAVVVSLARAFLPFIHLYHDDIEALVSDKLNAQVTFGSISGDWKNQGPSLQLTDIEVKSLDNSSTPVAMEELMITINLWRSLWHLRFVTDEIKLINSQIEIDLDSLSQSVSKTSSSESTAVYSSTDFLVETLLGQNDVVLSDIGFNFYNQQKSYPELKINQLVINNYDDVHQLTGQILQQGGGALNIVTEIYGDPRLPNSYIESYLQGVSVELPDLPLFESLVAGHIKQGTLSGEIWASWNYKGWQQVVADISVNAVDFSIKERSFFYPDISTLLVWKRHSKVNSEFQLKRFKAVSESSGDIDLAGLTVTVKKDKSTQVKLKYQNVEPGKLNNIWALMMIEPELQDWFLEANPQVEIKDLLLTVEKKNDKWDVISGYMNVPEAKLSRTSITPELPVLSGKLFINDNNVRYQLSAGVGQIDYGDLFSGPVETQAMSLQGDFIIFDGGSYLTFDALDLTLKHANILVRGNLYFPDNQSAELSLQAELSQTDLSNKKHLMPVGIMDDSLISYLNESVMGGDLRLARFNFQTVLEGDVLEHPATTFDILGFVENLDYKYQPDFPKLEQLNVTMFFDQNGMFIEATKGKLWDINVSKATAVISDFSAKIPWLDLDIKATTDHKSARKLINESMLKQILGDLLNDIQPAGTLNASTQLRIPLEGDDDIKVDGKVSLNDNDVYLPSLDLTPEKVTGSVQFNEKKVWSNNLSADLFGEKQSITIDTEDYDGSQRLTLKSNGKVNTKEVLNWLLPNNKLDVSGDADIKLSSWFCLEKCTAGNTGISITSNLVGTELSLPQPLGKPSDQEMLVNVTVDQTGEQQNIRFNVGQDLIANLQYNQDSGQYYLSQGTLSLNEKNTAVELIQDHLSISVSLKQANLADWLDSVTDFTASFSNENGSNNSVSSSEALPLIINFEIEQLSAWGIPVNNVTAKMIEAKAGGYQLDFTSDDVNGQVNLLEQGEVELVFDKLSLSRELLDKLSADNSEPSNNKGELNKDKVNNKEATSSDSQQVGDVKTNSGSDAKHESTNKPLKNELESSLDLTTLPELKIICKQCSIYGYDLGKVSLNTNPGKDDVQITGRIEKDNQLNAPFLYTWNKSDNVSELRVQYHSPALGALLRNWGFKVGIKESRAAGDIKLTWPGSVSDFNVANLGGGLTMSLSKGYLEEVSDAKARIFSLFSLQSLLRRLTLDFSDIYKDGFFYDSINGQFGIRDGRIITEQFAIDGNAAEVKISGMVDLGQETLDQYAQVTPKLTSSLPVIAGWAVEPTTGVLVWLLSKVFEPAIDVISNIDYRLVGSWQEPQVIELNKSTREVELTDDQLKAIQKVQQKDNPSLDDLTPEAIEKEKAKEKAAKEQAKEDAKEHEAKQKTNENKKQTIESDSLNHKSNEDADNEKTKTKTKTTHSPITLKAA